EHGVGRLDMVENRVVGLKSRGVYETPGGTVLMAALRDLEGVALDGAALRERMRAGEAYADLVYRGLWFTPVREGLDALVARLMEPVTADRPYSTDRNLFHISYEGGILEDPWAEPPDKMFLLTQSPEAAPDVPVDVQLDFEAGDPVAVDGARLDPVALLTRLNRLGGEHGIGRVDLVENRYVGMKSRGVYETPGGTILAVARRALESLTLDREVLHLRDSLVPRYAEMIYYGFWFSPERRALQAFMDECQRDVTGTVRLKLYKGNVTVAGRRSPRSLYRTDFATFEADTVYRQRDAEGFINLNALRLKIRALRDRRA
ncbi:MAG TPA: hypothetical protein VFX28_17335, partial [Methylomirabilota bacterium]|nr:hypothetical protein [Methylomirabilota bacterium]